MDAYLTKLHHPMEREGVDFWWVDWQQGTDSRMEGFDPVSYTHLIRDAEEHLQAARRLYNSSITAYNLSLIHI